ncbi:MAG: imidazolonepropionase [Gemmatimonadales bacterium]
MNPKPAADLLIEGAAELAAPDPGQPGVVRRVPGGVVAIAEGRVLAAGSREEVAAAADLERAGRLDAGGGLVVPGFVDCHTHLLYGGSRAREYATRLRRDPEALAALQAEGPTGIAASVAMTRRASDEELLSGATGRLDAMLARGTTTAESKTGYGLDVEQELRLLRLNQRLAAEHDVDVVSTLMAAHAFPPEAADAEGRERWVETIVAEIVPAAAELGAEFNDVFCDEGYFSADQARRVLEAGRAAGLAPKIHADQYAALGGAALAVELPVVSADHLNVTSDADLAALAAAGVVGVLMPLIDFAVDHPHPVDARRWARAGLATALATDCCPGGPAVSMPLAMQFACRVSALTPEQALWAATAGASRALGRDDRGAFAPGRQADVVVIDVPSLEELIYRLGHTPVCRVLKRGRVVV